MAPYVCPWWLGYFLVSPLRKLFQDPARILAPHVAAGMTVLEPGPGMGFFTLELARRVGAQGKVVAVDVQPKMLETLKRRAAKVGLAERIETRVVTPASLGVEDLAGKVDFILAFAMVHEVPDQAAFLAHLARALGPGKHLLVSEPQGHVTPAALARTLELAAQVGLREVDRPAIRGQISALLQRVPTTP